MVPKRVIEYHISRLKDKNPDVRLKAIRELELIAAPESLEVLKSVFETDADANVRKAAQEAGRTIFLKNREASADQ